MSSFKKRLAVAALTVSSALLLIPAAGQAAQTFGSDLQHQPNQTDCPGSTGACTVAALTEVPAPGQLSTAGSPIDGVITKFRVRAVVVEPTPVKLHVVDINPEGMPQTSATATGMGFSGTVTLMPADDEAAPQEFAAQLSVKKGEHLALEGSGLMATYDSSGSMFSYGFSPALVDGTATKSSEALGELLVQATVEPDVDGDGFGDETQDKCPTQKTGGAACDTTKPGVSAFKVLRGKATYRLSETASVAFVLKKKGRHGFKQFGARFSGTGKTGANNVALPHAHRLGAGAYRLTMTATDPAGNATTSTAAFLIEKKVRHHRHHR